MDFSYFYFLTIMNKSAMNIGIHKDLLESLFSLLCGIYLGVELLHHMLILYLTFWRTSKLFFTMVEPFYNPANSVC